MKKFTVFCNYAEDDGFRVNVENRAGRTWVSKVWHHDSGNCAEDAMIVGEMVNSGEKLDPAGWTEAAR